MPHCKGENCREEPTVILHCTCQCVECCKEYDALYKEITSGGKGGSGDRCIWGVRIKGDRGGEIVFICDQADGHKGSHTASHRQGEVWMSLQWDSGSQYAFKDEG